MTSGIVTSLHIHPVKSCHRIEVDSATVCATGLAHDRLWQVSAADGSKPVTQRQRAVLATVQPELIDGGLRLSAPGLDPIEIETPTANDTTTTSLIGQAVEVADGGEEAADWFSGLLGDHVRLHGATASSSHRAPAPIDLFGEQLSFADLAPVLVTNTASLDWLVARAAEPFDMARFRPNIVIETDEPFAEDTWARFTIGDCELRHGLAWPRCAIPQVDQDSGERHREPAVVLKAHRNVTSAPGMPDGIRPVIEGKSVFGVGCAIGPVDSVISVGDRLTVTATMTPLIAPPPS
jgi:uncharacterized protein YcbX